jgi:3-oxoadipate enol-lactonase
MSVRDIDVYYEQAGRGPKLLFISGTGGDLRVRPNVLDSPLVESFEVVAYDQRGLGQTSKPEGPYSMADYAADAAALLDALGWEQALVMGVSFGGMVAQELILRAPEKVRALVLACTSAGGAGGASFPLHELAGLPEEERLSRHLALSDLRRDARWREANPERWARLLRIARERQSEARDHAGAQLQLAARAQHDTWQRLADVRVPVLLAGGRHDGIAPVANMAALARQIPDAELRFFEGGHLFLIQDEDAYPYIIQWLSGKGTK